MQVKIVIGTIAFMLAMIVFGYSALREPARLELYTEAAHGRSVEWGAKLYYDNCATCHGTEGKAEECFDAASGEPTGCQGLPLNYAPLLCGDTSLRMEAMNWEGTKAGFIQNAVAAGRVGSVMPTWSNEYGGPLRQDQLLNLTDFVLNWESEELCSAPLITYDWPEDFNDFQMEFPEPGDVAAGEELYLSYGCAGCHGNLEDEASATVGPWQGDLPEVAPNRVEGMSAEQYVYESILYPDNYVVEECPTGPCTDPSSMPDNFPLRMAENPQDMIDIMTYLGILPAE